MHINKSKFVNAVKKNLIWMAILMMMLIGNTAQAQSNNSGSGQQAFCKRDFGNFLSTGLEFDTMNFWDFWADIVDIPFIGWSRYSSNYCHFSEIESIRKNIDKVRKLLRQAFYVCDVRSVARHSAKYAELTAEIYYLRNFIDTKPFVTSTSDENVKNDNVKVKANFRVQFIQKLTNNNFSSAYANQLYEKYRKKYEPKLETYRNCEDPNIGALIQKLKELANTLETVKKLGRKFIDTTKKKAARTQARVNANPGLLTVFSANSASDFFRRVIDIRINGEAINDPNYWDQVKEGQGSIFQALEDNLPGSNEANNKPGSTLPSRGISMSELASDIVEAEKRDSEKNMEIIYFGMIDTKYRQVGDTGLDINLGLLNSLEDTLKATFPELEKVETCTETILNKQCGG